VTCRRAAVSSCRRQPAPAVRLISYRPRESNGTSPPTHTTQQHPAVEDLVGSRPRRRKESLMANAGRRRSSSNAHLASSFSLIWPIRTVIVSHGHEWAS
jgi:hypothetical protein